MNDFLPNSDFTFHMELAKSDNSSDEDRLVRGLASCETVDVQGEVILQKGMDCSPALKSGWVNWDHMPGPENLIGIPLKIEIADIQQHPVMSKSGLKGIGCYAEARLLKGHARAEAVWSLLKSVGGSGRGLAWSVQGSVLERSGSSNNYLARTVIRHLAITHQPVQTDSFAELAKSLTTALAAPLRLENLDAGMTNVSSVKDLLYGRCKDTHFGKGGKFRDGTRGMLEHLIVCKGETLEDSKKFLKTCIEHKIIHI